MDAVAMRLLEIMSLLTRASRSHWVWPHDVDVVHVYLTQAQLTATSREMYDREVEDVELDDVLRADDPVPFRSAMQIAAEAATAGPGTRLLVEALTQQTRRAHPAPSRPDPVSGDISSRCLDRRPAPRCPRPHHRPARQ